jgi:hypothetical protein
VPTAEQRLYQLFIKYHSQFDYGDELGAITKPQQTLCLAYEFIRKVNNGGFNQYFSNASGNHAHQSLGALWTIGAINCASLLQRAISVWPDELVPKDWETRRNVLEDILEKVDATWVECDSSVYNGRESITQLLLFYIDLQPEEFDEQK